MGAFNPKRDEFELALASAIGAFDEIILVDDGSTLPLVQIDDIKIIRHEENLGFWAARNTGVREAKNEWISFLDCDDYFNPNDLDLLYQFAETVEDDIDIIHFPVKLFGSESGTWAVNPDTSLTAFKEGNRIPSGSWYRKRVWEKLGGYNKVLGAEDWDFWLRAAASGCKFKYFHRFVYSHRVSPTGETAKYKSTHENIKEQVLKNLAEYELSLN